jgi:hypothetical protein
MTKLTRSSLFLLALLALACQPVFAQAPTGAVTLNFDKTTIPLIDLQGTFDPTNQVVNGVGDATVPLSYLGGLGLTHHSNGRLTGTGVIPVQIGEDFVAATYKAVGSVHGGGNRLTRVQLTVLLTGKDVIVGVESTFRIIITYNLVLNVDDWTLEGTSRGSVKLGSVGRGSVRSNVIVPLNGTGDGAWSANLNILALKKIGGSGTITLPTGRSIPGVLGGSFALRSNLSRVRFTGINEGKGSTATFNLTPTDESPVAVQTVRGRILGQTVLE